MGTIKSFLLFSTLLLICSCHGCFRGVSDELLPNGGNPELISYLQGKWVLSTNDKVAMVIQRDSIIESNDSARTTKNLSYLFAGTADGYFTKDSVFDFTSQGGHGLSTDDFKLIENGDKSSDTITHLLAYVSRSRLVMTTHGKFTEFKR